MSKAQTQDLTAMGFAPEQFGGCADFVQPENGYLVRLLTEIELRVRGLVSDAIYDAATAVASGSALRDYHLLRSAESYLAAAELWRRREAFADASLSVGRAGGEALTIGSRYLENAARYAGQADDLLAEVCGKRLGAGSGASFGAIETGQFTAVL